MPSAKRVANPVVAEKPQESTIVNRQVSIRSIFPAHLKYAGHISGKAYEWREAGAVVAVDSDDVPYLLERRIGERACCGASGNGNRLFEIA